MLDHARFRNRDLENSLTAWRRERKADDERTGSGKEWYQRGENRTDEFGAVLIHGEMYGAKGTSTDLLLDDILIDSMFPLTVVGRVGNLGPSVARFL